jgi:Spy/CpxP family protein refolding chaperone
VPPASKIFHEDALLLNEWEENSSYHLVVWPKRMKIFNLALFVVALSSLAVGAYAQAPGAGPMGGGRMGGGRMGGMRGPRMKPGEREKKMLGQLNLTPGQKKRTDVLIDEMVGKMMKMRPVGGGRPTPEMFMKFKTIRDGYNAKIDKVLKPGQLKKLEELRKESRARRGMGRGMGRPGGPGGPGAKG